MKSRLSTAVAEGAKLRPMAHSLFLAEVEPGVYGSCSLGAAYEAVCGPIEDPERFYPVANVLRTTLERQCDVDFSQYVDNPLYGRRESLWDTIIHLSDSRLPEWDREGVATWLKGLGL